MPGPIRALARVASRLSGARGRGVRVRPQMAGPKGRLLGQTVGRVWPRPPSDPPRVRGPLCVMDCWGNTRNGVPSLASVEPRGVCCPLSSPLTRVPEFGPKRPGSNKMNLDISCTRAPWHTPAWYTETAQSKPEFKLTAFDAFPVRKDGTLWNFSRRLLPPPEPPYSGSF